VLPTFLNLKFQHEKSAVGITEGLHHFGLSLSPGCFDMDQSEFIDCTTSVDQFCKLLDEIELPANIDDAIVGLGAVDLDIHELKTELSQTRQNMIRKLKDNGAGSILIDHAQALYLYTHDHFAICSVIDSHIFSPDRNAKDTLQRLMSCLPFIKFVDSALLSLPAQFRFSGRVYRGIKWVFQSLQEHDPEKYFFHGRSLQFLECKSASKVQEAMLHDRFCGHKGPRTIFSIDATDGYDVSLFSNHGEVGAGVLFRPLAKMEARGAVKGTDMLCQVDSGEGSPDMVNLVQTTSGHDYAPGALIAAPPAAASAVDSPAGIAASGLALLSDLEWRIEELLAWEESGDSPVERSALLAAMDAGDATLAALLGAGACDAGILTGGQRIAVERAIQRCSEKVPCCRTAPRVPCRTEARDVREGGAVGHARASRLGCGPRGVAARAYRRQPSPSAATPQRARFLQDRPPKHATD
jgi:hypothetical protein